MVLISLILINSLALVTRAITFLTYRASSRVNSSFIKIGTDIPESRIDEVTVVVDSFVSESIIALLDVPTDLMPMTPFDRPLMTLLAPTPASTSTEMFYV